MFMHYSHFMLAGDITMTSKGGEQGTVLAETAKTCSFGSYTWVNIKLTSGENVWGQFFLKKTAFFLRLN